MAVAGLVLGIVGLVLSWSPFVSLVMAIVGVTLSALARKKQPTGMATAGLVLNIIALCLSGLLVLTCSLCSATSCGWALL